MTPELLFVLELVTAKEHVSARQIYRMIEPDAPFEEWIKHCLDRDNCEMMNDYIPVDGDYLLTPIMGTIFATSGGSTTAAKYQVAYCSYLASTVFKGKNFMQVFSDGIAAQSGEDFLKRELDPEK